jgi:hypothetical protein
MPGRDKRIEHVTSEAAEHTGQPNATRPPQGERNTDPYTNSGYPAGGGRSQPGRDPFGRKRDDSAPARRGRG